VIEEGEVFYQVLTVEVTMKLLNLSRISLLRCTIAAAFVLGVFQSSMAAVARPVLKWQYGGCYSSWCETGWYSSPAVADLDGDGRQEVIASAYSIVVLNGATGALKYRLASGHDRSEPGAASVGRTWPGIVVGDVDNDGKLEMVTAHSGGYVSVYDNNGFFKPGWPKRPVSNELRGLSVADLENDGTAEIIVTGAVYGKTNTWVYEHSGQLRAGWPQLSNNSGYSYGVFNDKSTTIRISNWSSIPRQQVLSPTICLEQPGQKFYGVPVEINSMNTPFAKPLLHLFCHYFCRNREQQL
jgi:hypothetical protein